MKARVLIVSLSAALLSGCATIERDRQIQAQRAEEVTQRMNTLIGVWTYDEALMRMGKPNSIEQGDTIFVATWVRGRPPKNTIYTYPARSAGSIILRGIEARGTLTYTVLSFDKRSKTLRSWNIHR